MLTRLLELYLSIFGITLEPEHDSNEALKNWLLSNPDKTIDDYLFNTHTNNGTTDQNTNDAPRNLGEND